MRSPIIILSQGGGHNRLPTREQVLNYKASFCSHRDSLKNVVFDPAFSNASDKMRYDWLKVKNRMTVTHMVLCPINRYPAYDHIVPSFDFQSPSDLAIKFIPRVYEVQNAGLIPHIKITNGDPEDQARVEDGRFRRTCEILRDAGLSKYCVWDSGWENFGANPSWSTLNITRAFNIMVDVFGEDLVMAAHINSTGNGRCTWASWPVQPNDPTNGDEMGAHYCEGGKYVSLYMYQIDMTNELNPVVDPMIWYTADPNGPENLYNRWAECLERFVPVGTYIPAINRYTQGPFWFTLPRPIGPERMVMFEPAVPYYYIRDWCSDEDVKVVSRLFSAYGVLQGCWVPN